jgi:GNAT superfamily N-acetyltransferase
MTAYTMPPIDPTLSDLLLHDAQLADGAALPIAGWSLHRRKQPDERTVIEVNDDTGDLIGLITSTSVPILTVDAAWRGRGHALDGTRRWWALAIGHASSNDDNSVVTFARHVRAHGSLRRTVVPTSRLQGLWIAAVPGLYTMITCRQGPEHRIRRLAPAPRLHARA